MAAVALAGTSRLAALAAPGDAAYVMGYCTESPSRIADRYALHLAVSMDGLQWTALNQGNPVATPTAGTGGLRDPFIMRKQNVHVGNGTNYLYYKSFADGRLYGARSSTLNPRSFDRGTYTTGVVSGGIEAPIVVKAHNRNEWWLWGDSFAPVNGELYAWRSGDINTNSWTPLTKAQASRPRPACRSARTTSPTATCGTPTTSCASTPSSPRSTARTPPSRSATDHVRRTSPPAASRGNSGDARRSWTTRRPTAAANERLPRAAVRRAATALAVVAGLTGALLTGCGTDVERSSTSVTRLSFWSGYAGPAPSTLEAIVDEFNAANPDVRIEVSLMPWDVFFQNLLPAYFSEGGPDLAAFDSTRVPQYAQKGVLAPVDDWFAAEPASNALVTAAVDAVTYQGSKYAVPMTFTSLKLCYNRALFTEAGLDPDQPPTTWDQWRTALTRLTRDRDDDGVPEQHGIALPDHEAIPVWPILLWGHGGDILTPDGSRSALTSPEAVGAVRTWVDLVAREHVSPTGLSGTQAEELFRDGKAAMTITGPWATGGFQAAGVDFDLAPVPPGPFRQATLGTTTSLALNAELSPEKKRAAHRFLSHWVGEQAQQSWMKGSGYPSIRLDQYPPNDNPLVGQFADDARIAQPVMPGVVQFAKIHDDVFEPAIRNIISGEAGVDDGLATASRRIDEILTETG
ncbi:hypothetical protein A6A25_39485 [Saccharothrix sp. CB00851]|nr:hypothetical protein A6A25_39485 [Saccharothrix sp. CB00851]